MNTQEQMIRQFQQQQQLLRRPISNGQARASSQLPNIFEEPAPQSRLNSSHHRSNYSQHGDQQYPSSTTAAAANSASQSSNHSPRSNNDRRPLLKPPQISPRGTFMRTSANFNPLTQSFNASSATPHAGINGVYSQPPSQDTLKTYLEAFNKQDTQSIGLIPISSIQSMSTALNKDLSHLSESRLNAISKTKEGFLTFDEFLNALSILSPAQFEQQYQQQMNMMTQNSMNGQEKVKLDMKVIEYLRMLGEYRRKCESDGNYSDARKAHDKIREIKKKEQLRQKNQLRLMQESELSEVDMYQRTSVEEFAKAWDAYIAEYEATAYLSLEKMKEKHQQEIEVFVQELREEFFSKVKASKQLLALRHKEKLLVKIKNYADAEIIKSKADMLQEQENLKNHIEIKDKIKLQVATLRKSQTQVMQALMKRIQTDRTQQSQQRQFDSIKLINRNRNFKNDLMHKHSAEVRRALDLLKENLHMQEEEEPSNGINSLLQYGRNDTENEAGSAGDYYRNQTNNTESDLMNSKGVTGDRLNSAETNEANVSRLVATEAFNSAEPIGALYSNYESNLPPVTSKTSRSISDANNLYEVEAKIFGHPSSSSNRRSSQRKMRSTSYNGRKFREKSYDSFTNPSPKHFLF